MADTIPLGQPLEARLSEQTSASVTSVPWTIWCVFAGIVSSIVGGLWDISWHMSIGRDTFWTPAHILIQLNGVLVGIACGYMILTTTFGGDAAEHDASVKIWGFRGPLGAFIATWGCVAMLTSAPFDNWWHNAYGLDVKIVSPPHTLLSLGSFAIKVGALALMAGLMNRAQPQVRRKVTWLSVFVGAVCVTQLGLILTIPTWPVNMHTAKCYLAVAIGIPAVLMGPAWGLAKRWACTLVAGTYTVILLAFQWILPLIPAEPKLGPVYQNVKHLIPLRFPLLLIVPAVVLDLLWNRTEQWGRWKLAAVSGPAFVLSFLAVQWPFANFLMSPGARNWFFGMAYFAYFDPAGLLYDPYQFQIAEKTRGEFWMTLIAALVVSVITARLSLSWGDWMRRMRR
ncbi:MAG: hypothetical protein WB762_24240 [Candidatus Sulfotelmatobacter sp.]